MRRGLLLDRDGVINHDTAYVGFREQFQFIDGVFDFLRAAQDLGFRIAILTNQAGVGRGKYTSQDYEALTEWMIAELARQNITVELVLGCFEHPDAVVGPYRRESFWRKPNPGMVLEAIQRLRLDPARSAFIGDQLRDLEAAKAGGIVQRLLLSRTIQPEDGMTRVATYDEALEILRTISTV